MRDQFIARLLEMAKLDPRIMLVTGDLGFGVFNEYREQLPKQFINAGVAEQNMMGLAAGLALEGHIVYTYSIANFAFMRCLEQVRNDASYHDANVNVVCIGGGFSYGALGISHHATEDLAIMRSLPGLTVVSPCDHWETVQATEAIANQQGTCYLRLDKSHAQPTHVDGEEFQLGKARQLRDGRDVSLVATGGVMGEVLAAADQLEQGGVSCRVLSYHTIKPLDTAAAIQAATETSGMFVVEEHVVHGGLGSAIAEELLEAGCVPSIFQRIGLRGGFASIVGSQSYLRSQYGLDAASIVATIRERLDGKQLTSHAA